MPVGRIPRDHSGHRPEIHRISLLQKIPQFLLFVLALLSYQINQEEYLKTFLKDGERNGKCRVLATTWEWKEDIDAERARDAKKRAEELLAKGGLSDKDFKVVQAKLHRALVRLSVNG